MRNLKYFLILLPVFGFFVLGYNIYNKTKTSTNIPPPNNCLPRLILPKKERNDFYETPNWYQNYSKSQIDFLGENVFVYAKTPEDARNVFFKETECGNSEFVKALYGPGMAPSEPADWHDSGFDIYWKIW
jgi:hypothetical protein